VVKKLVVEIFTKMAITSSGLYPILMVTIKTSSAEIKDEDIDLLVWIACNSSSHRLVNEIVDGIGN
jgi:hypothetical protein